MTSHSALFNVLYIILLDKTKHYTDGNEESWGKVYNAHPTYHMTIIFLCLKTLIKYAGFTATKNECYNGIYKKWEHTMH